MNEERLDAYLLRGKALFGGELIDGKTLDQREGYKFELVKNLEKARMAVVNDHDDWDKLLQYAVKPSKNNKNNITEGSHRQFFPVLRDWLNSKEDRATDCQTILRALKALWTEEDKSAGDRVRAFADIVAPEDGFRTASERLTPIAYLLMALGHDYPPFRWEKLEKVYGHLGYLKRPKINQSNPATNDLVKVYDHALNFFDQLVQHSDGRPNDRLDAQSLVWTMHGFLENGMIKPPSTPLTALAEKLLLRPTSFLSEIVWPMLEDKKQIIFQGPPGTGKTYVARELAKCLAGSEDRVELVQFHPSYAYEDFVQGFRPTLEGGSAGFAMQNGPLLRMAKRAFEEPSEKHFLVIDEINRGNLAKVFGELYFLLEYRGKEHKMRLQYSNTEFWMPENLYIIGTMNTADRSIALVDAALRRRFYFVPFHPNEEPIKGLLKEWLEREAKKREAEERKWSDEMEWLPGVVDAANKKLSEKLGNEETAIGPSYFMKGDIPEKMERVWKYNVLPYIEEQMYDQRGRVKDDFALKALKEEAARVSAPQAEGATEQGDPDESAPDGGEG